MLTFHLAFLRLTPSWHHQPNPIFARLRSGLAGRALLSKEDFNNILSFLNSGCSNTTSHTCDATLPSQAVQLSLASCCVTPLLFSNCHADQRELFWPAREEFGKRTGVLANILLHSLLLVLITSTAARRSGEFKSGWSFWWPASSPWLVCPGDLPDIVRCCRQVARRQAGTSQSCKEQIKKSELARELEFQSAIGSRAQACMPVAGPDWAQSGISEHGLSGLTLRMSSPDLPKKSYLLPKYESPIHFYVHSSDRVLKGLKDKLVPKQGLTQSWI